MVKVVHILQTFGIGGMESRVARLASGLCQRGFEITVLTLRPTVGRTPAIPSQVKLAQVGIESGLHPSGILDLRRFIKSGGFSIVHTHNWSTMLYGVLASKSASAPITIHGEHGLNFHDLSGITWKRRGAQMLLASMCDHIVSVSKQMSGVLQRDWKLQPSKLSAIPNGVDLSRFTRSMPSGDSEFIIGTVGRLDKVKNFSCLIRAVALLKSSHRDNTAIRLVFVGDGPEKAQLEEVARELGALSFVTFAGDISEPSTWYSRFSVFVNSSFYEGMSNTILEAMASGLPVIASKVEGNTSWLKEDENALFFESDKEADLAEKLSRLIGDFRMGKEMGDRNRLRVEQEFDNQLFLGHYERLYRSLLEIKKVAT